MRLADGYDLVIFDLDGVVYLGGEPVPGAVEAISSIVETGPPVEYVTNNASRRAGEVAALLRSLGIPAREDEVLTSAQAAAALLAEGLPAGAEVLVVGAPALAEEVRAVGLAPITAYTGERPAAVVQGYGPSVGWADLAEACVAVRAGARWVATNVDATLPSPRGPLPGNGSLVAALSTALGGRAPDTVVGKPSPALFEVAARRRNARRALVVGDRLDTDIEGAVRAGMDSLLVLTGVSTAADLLRAGPGERPTHVAADTRALSTMEEFSRVPEWQADRSAARAGPWQATRDDGRLVLALHAPTPSGPEPASTRSGREPASTPSGPEPAPIPSGPEPAPATIGPEPRLVPGDGEADTVGALRALAAAAWAAPWREVTAGDVAAAGALAAWGLD